MLIEIKGRVFNWKKFQEKYSFLLVEGKNVYKIFTNENVFLADHTLVFLSVEPFGNAFFLRQIEIISEEERFSDQFLVRTKNSSLQRPSVVDLKYLAERISCLGIADNMSVHSFKQFSELSEKFGFQPIFGCDLNVFDDTYNPFQYCQNILSKKLSDLTMIFLDLETNGIDSQTADIIEIGYLIVSQTEILNQYSFLCRTKQIISPEISELTNIYPEMLVDAFDIKDVLSDFAQLFHENVVLLTHRKFDLAFLRRDFQRFFSQDFQPNFLDTYDLFRMFLPELKKYSLENVLEHFKIINPSKHRALTDARATFLATSNCFNTVGYEKTLKELSDDFSIDFKTADVKSIPVFLKNENSFAELNNLLSLGYTKYMYKIPKVPLSELKKQKNLIYTSTTNTDSFLYEEYFFAGTKFDLPLDFVFLIEPEFIQRENMLRNSSESGIQKKSILLWYEELKKRYQYIFNSPVNCIYPTDSEALASLTNIIFPAHASFSYAKELISHQENDFRQELKKQCQFFPSKKQCTLFPELFNIDQKIEENLKRIYGLAKDHSLIQERLKQEKYLLLKNSVQNIYIIVAYLVEKIKKNFSTIIGSRGSVGSSFLAFVLGITEVNSLPPHYFCPSCGFLEEIHFRNGLDAPEKDCSCGKKLKKDGHFISFHIFSGLHGEKIPDIDLNVDSRIHDQVQEFILQELNEMGIFSQRISSTLTLKAKNALFYVGKFSEKISETRKELLAYKLQDCKLSMTQHPGGILLLPQDIPLENITALQYSSGEKKLVTHLDYYNISANIFKLDILAHDDPGTLVNMCHQENINPDDIDILSPLTLFTEQDTTGIPDFGTQFVKKILSFLSPKKFSDLVKISGLTHGTNVWNLNGHELIKKGKTLDDIISVRDDIYDFLISFHLPNEKAYEIMEFIRKGMMNTNLQQWEEYTNLLKRHQVPEWYIDSCSKITYIFPRAHAVAYVLMAMKIAYFKKHFKYCFFANFFNRKIDYVDYDFFCLSDLKLIYQINQFRHKTLEQKDKVTLQLLEAIQEIRANNIKINDIDLYHSDSEKFIYNKDGIFPPFNIMKGFGDQSGKIICSERNKKFTDFLDFKHRTNLHSSKIEILKKYKILPFDIITEVALF